VIGNLKAAQRRAAPWSRPQALRQREALLVATACSNPPKGRARWTLELLAGEPVRLTEHASISRETVRRRPAENELKPWRKDMWCIPPVDGEFVARMEDVLDLYAQEPDRKRPSVSTKARPSSSVRFASRSRPSRGSWSVTIASTSVMAQPICSSSSTCIGPGARSSSSRPNAPPRPALSRTTARYRRVQTDQRCSKISAFKAVWPATTKHSEGQSHQARRVHG
jgi:hypothetical protein